MSLSENLQTFEFKSHAGFTTVAFDITSNYACAVTRTETDGTHGKETGFPVRSVDHDPARAPRGAALITYEITGTG